MLENVNLLLLNAVIIVAFVATYVNAINNKGFMDALVGFHTKTGVKCTSAIEGFIRTVLTGLIVYLFAVNFGFLWTMLLVFMMYLINGLVKWLYVKAWEFKQRNNDLGKVKKNE